jgi:hypothetical protein
MCFQLYNYLESLCKCCVYRYEFNIFWYYLLHYWKLRYSMLRYLRLRCSNALRSFRRSLFFRNFRFRSSQCSGIAGHRGPALEDMQSLIHNPEK